MAIITLATSVPQSRLSGGFTAFVTVVATLALTRSSRPQRLVVWLALAPAALAVALVPFASPELTRADPLTPPVLLGRLGIAPLVSPGFIAALAAPAFVGSLALALRRSPSSLPMFLVAALLAVIVLASGARGAMVASFAGLLALLGSWGGATRRLLLVLPLGTLAILVADPLVHLGRSTDSRLGLWIVVTWLNSHSPAGIGFGAFVDHGVVRLGREELAGQLSAHNLLFQTWADLGPLGVAALLVTAIAALSPVRLRAMPSGDRRVFISLVACLATLGCTESVISAVAFEQHATLLDPLLFVVLALPFARWESARGGLDDGGVPAGGAVGREFG